MKMALQIFFYDVENSDVNYLKKKTINIFSKT